MSVWRISDPTTTFFGNSYFISIHSTITNTWVNHKDTSDTYTPANQVANYGVDTFFEFITKFDQTVILLLQSYYSNLNNNPYLKLNSSFVVFGSCPESQLPCDYSTVEWIEDMPYKGNWSYIYPGFCFFSDILFLFYQLKVSLFFRSQLVWCSTFKKRE